MANPARSIRLIVGIIACLFLAFGIGCKSEAFKIDKLTVHYSGDFDKGGCGWILVLDSLNAYQAVNLADFYKTEGQVLTVTYKVLDNKPDCTNSKVVKDVIYLHKVAY